MSHNGKIRLVCVDDNAEILSAMSMIFENNLEIAAIACLDDARELETCIERDQPDVVTIDLWMPGHDSISILRDAKSRYPDVQFLILSAADDEEHVERALENGATGYALKDGNFERLAEAIRTVAAGKLYRPRRGGLPREVSQ
jgi:DNA-binding NarL/FixJ family response regulator